MKFTPVTPNYQENATANESIRSRNASSNKYHVVTEEGKGRHVHSAAADSDSHDSRIDNYRFGTLATGSSSSSTSTSPFATDACESASNGIDAGVARRRSVVRRRQVASAGVVVAGRPCACCKRYNMHLRSHDDCVAWHTRSHGDAGPVRARSPSEPSHAPSRSSAREFNLRCLPEYPVAPSDSGQSPRRSLGLLCIACVVVVVVAVAAAAASCLLLARTGPLQHLGRPGAWSAGLPLHWAGNGTSSTAPAPPLPLPLPPPPLRREHPQPRSPLGPESSSPSDEQNRALDSDSSDLDLDLDLRRTEMDAASALQEGAGPIGSVANHSALSGTPPSPSSSSSSWAAGYGSCYEEGQGQGQEEGFVSGGGPSFPNDCPIPIPPRPRPSWEPPGLLFGRGPAPEPDPNPNLSGAGSAGRRAPYRRRRMKKLASVTISLVETINGSDSDGGGSRKKKALEVLDYAVFPRGGQVVPPSTFRSAADGEYLTSAEHAPTRPTPAARKKIQIPFKIGSVIQPAEPSNAASMSVGGAGGKALRSHEHLVSHLPASSSGRLCLAGQEGGRVTVLLHSPVAATELVVQSVIPTYHWLALLRNSSSSNSNSSNLLALSGLGGGGLADAGESEPSPADRAIFGATVGRIRVRGWTADPRMRWGFTDRDPPFHLGDFRFAPDEAAAAATANQSESPILIDGGAAVVVSQAFPLAMADASSGAHVPPLRAVTLTVLSNYGNSDCTCLYRLKVLGVLFQ